MGKNRYNFRHRLLVDIRQIPGNPTDSFLFHAYGLIPTRIEYIYQFFISHEEFVYQTLRQTPKYYHPFYMWLKAELDEEFEKIGNYDLWEKANSIEMMNLTQESGT